MITMGCAQLSSAVTPMDAKKQKTEFKSLSKCTRRDRRIRNVLSTPQVTMHAQLLVTSATKTKWAPMAGKIARIRQALDIKTQPSQEVLARAVVKLT